MIVCGFDSTTKKKHAKQNDEEEMDEKEEGRQKLNQKIICGSDLM